MGLDMLDGLLNKKENVNMEQLKKESEVIVEEYMQVITVTTYPNGQKFFKTQIWDKNKGQKKTFKAKPKYKKKKMKDFKLKNKEEY